MDNIRKTLETMDRKTVEQLVQGATAYLDELDQTTIIDLLKKLKSTFDTTDLIKPHSAPCDHLQIQSISTNWDCVNKSIDILKFLDTQGMGFELNTNIKDSGLTTCVLTLLSFPRPLQFLYDMDTETISAEDTLEWLGSISK